MMRLHSTTDSSKHKAKLLLQMANAVEDSNARNRHRLHPAGAADAETLDQLLWELEQEVAPGHHDRIHRTNTAITVNNHHDSNGMIQPQQVQFLYTAMIRCRENAELRYQLLELRHLNLSQAFVELESRYRHLESQQEAWQQSCEAFKKASADGDALYPAIGVSNSGSNNDDNNNKSTTHTILNGTRPTTRYGGSLSFQNSALLMLQEEIKILSSQRNQLLKANFELRKQLKQMQIQMQTPKAGEEAITATCRRCHPELLEGRQQVASETLDSLIDQFHPSSSHSMGTTTSSISQHQTTGEERKREEGVLSVSATEEFVVMRDASQESDDSSPEAMDNTVKREEHKFESRMNLLGMQLGGSSRQIAARDDPVGLWGSQHQTQPQPIKQTSIVWSPSAQDQKKVTSPQQRNKTVIQMVPTISSILPMPQRQQPKKLPQQDIHVSPRLEARPSQTSHPELGSKHALKPPEINCHQVTAPAKAKEGMGQLGPSADSRLIRASSAGSSTHCGITVSTANASTPQQGFSRFRRLPGTVLPVQPQQQAPTANLAQSAPNYQATGQPRQHRSPQQHSIVSPPPSATPRSKAAVDRHLEYHFPGTSAPVPTATRHAMVGTQRLMTARHLEFASAPATTSLSIMRGPVKNPAPRSDGSTQRRVAQPVIKRPAMPLDEMLPAMNPASSTSHAGVRNIGPATRITNGLNVQGGDGLTVLGPPSNRGVPLMPNNQDHHQPYGTHSQQQQQQQQQPASHAIGPKSKEEIKPKRASRPQSYFERIKKTLQQEI